MSRTTERQASIFVVSLINLDEGAAVSGGVGLAVDGHAPHLGEGRGEVPQLGHGLAAANLLSDVLGLAVVLGHAGESNPLLPHAHRVALALAGEEGNLREAE